jgi:protein disulfide-isomerase A6
MEKEPKARRTASEKKVPALKKRSGQLFARSLWTWKASHFLTSNHHHIATMLPLLHGVLSLSALVAVQGALFPSKSPVVQLTQSNFNKEVLSIEKPTMVMFSAPWCGPCKNLAPHYHKAASTLDGIVKFANLDCDADMNKGLCAQYQIQGFPTLKLFPATKKRLPREYRGERTAKGLVEYAKETLPQGARRIDPAELEKYVNENPTRPKVILFSNK